jgi:magnesium transporter
MKNPQKPKGVLTHEPKVNGNGNVILELIQYNETDYVRKDNLPVEQLIGELKPNYVNWINVDGLHDQSIISALGKHFNIHSLLLEDINTDHQPKSEEYDDYLFFTLKMLYRIENGVVDYEQISFILGKDFVVSFQEKEGDLFDAFRERIRLNQGRVRKLKGDYLLYRLIDIIVDHYYQVLDAIGLQVENIEEDIYQNPSEDNFFRIQKVKKDLLFLRKALYPLRDALSKLLKDESEFVESGTVRYFNDVYDHVVHLIDSLETYKDLNSGLMDIHINAMNTRMNEVMKVLTVISTIFMPLTFIVGVYGMNFDFMPELHWKWGYAFVWGIMIVISVLMINYFKYKKWF